MELFKRIPKNKLIIGETACAIKVYSISSKENLLGEISAMEILRRNVFCTKTLHDQSIESQSLIVWILIFDIKENPIQICA